jgi:ParB family chromosome partitioning protein
VQLGFAGVQDLASDIDYSTTNKPKGKGRERRAKMVATQEIVGQEALGEGRGEGLEPFTLAEKALGVAVNRVVDMPLDWLVADPGNERKDVDEGIDEMQESIREGGVREPLIAYRVGPNQYMLSGGHRRRRGAELEGLRSLLVLVRAAPQTEAQQALDRLVLNLQRKELSALEKARGFQAVLDSRPGMTQGELARKLGISQPQVANTLRLLSLPDEVLTVVEEQGLPAGVGTALLKITDDEMGYSGKKGRSALEVQLAFASRAAQEGWSVHVVEKVVATHLGEQKHVRQYLESQRKQREESARRNDKALADAKRNVAAAEGQPVPPALSDEELVKQERSKAFFEGRARTARIKVAHATLRKVTAIDPKGGPSLDHLKLAAMAIIDFFGYSETAELWEMPSKDVLRKSVLAATGKSELLLLLSQLALSRLNVTWDGMSLAAQTTETWQFANAAWDLKAALSAGLQEADLLDSHGNKIIPGPKQKSKRRSPELQQQGQAVGVDEERQD